MSKLLDDMVNANSLEYIPLHPYNGTTDTGGDSLTENLNVFYESGDLAWVLTSTALVLMMVPGAGLFYAGLARRGSALALLFLSLVSLAVVSFQWFFWGYSLTFSHTSGRWIGDLQNIGFRNVLARPSTGSPKIPDLLYAVYQGMFACVTVALAVGATSERGRMLPCIIFMFCWTTLIYDPIACSTWNPSGWSYRLGGLDFAGGTPVHIASGCAALAYSLLLGERSGYRTRPHNVSMVVMGTVFLWVGWMGFNGGSALGANLRAVVACTNTNVTASVAGIAWCLMDLYFHGSWSCVGFCMGAISGCVAITPGAGFVPVWAAVIFGLFSGLGSNLATKLKHVVAIDDAMDVFAVHTISGFIGNMLTGFFAADYIAHLDGFTVIKGGLINGHAIQIAYQLADSLAGALYSFFGSLLILFCISKIPYCHLRIDHCHENPQATNLNGTSAGGLDKSEIGELMYDFVEANTDVTQLNRLEESLNLLAEKITALVNTRVIKGSKRSAFETTTTISSAGSVSGVSSQRGPMGMSFR